MNLPMISVKIRASLLLGFFVAGSTVLAGCAGQQLGAREKGALGGAALGAGLGAIIGNQVGDPGAGVAIGSAFGAITGGLIGNEIDNQDAAFNDQERLLEEQERQLQENRRLIEELKRRGTDARLTDRGVVINLPDVLFDFDSAHLTSAALATARDIARVANDQPGRRIAVEGHTDSLGTETYNQRLSLERARSVSQALIDSGVKRGRITTRGYGESQPIDSNQSESGRQRNRRVEVVIEN